MRRDVRTDWTVRDDVRAKLRSSIKRLLMKYGYPPDTQPGAIGPRLGRDHPALQHVSSAAARKAMDRLGEHFAGALDGAHAKARLDR